MFMKKLFHLFLGIGISCLNISCSEDDEGTPNGPSPLEEQTLLNISYGSHPQEVFDLYLPAGRSSQSTRVIMLIHGGGWTQGDKSEMNAFVYQLKLTHPDYAIANVNYVLANGDIKAFPHQFLDIQAIIQKLTNEKEYYQIKPDFGLVGVSAGAHIALMYDSVYDTSNQVKFVADIVGPTNFEDPFYEEQFPLGGIYWYLVDQSAYPEGTNYLYELSPVNHIGNHTSPTAMFYGNEDPLVPVTNAHDLEAKLIQYNIPRTLKIYNGGHGNWSQTDLNDAWSIVNHYIETYLP